MRPSRPVIGQSVASLKHVRVGGELAVAPQKTPELNRDCRSSARPKSGFSQARLNPTSEWMAKHVPQLRVAPDDLWTAAKSRQKQTRHTMKTVGAIGAAKRPQYLFSGLTKCGICGAGFIMSGKNRLGCFGTRDQGRCDNHLTIRRDEIETRVLRALQEKLLRQDLFEEFCDEFTREMNRLRMEHRANVRIPLQVDVGAGDAVVPPPEVLDYPGLLDLPRARLRAYRPETSIAEKTEAMVRLALANSRMKDFFDIHRLAETRTFDCETMRLAVAATFTRRGIEIPGERPLALTSEFADDTQKKVQWAAFVRRARRPELGDLSAIIATLDRFLWPVLQAAARGEPWPRIWSNGGPWKEP
jgi:Nucleotidyl transferase AbiEii toxin, Type IV TA system/Recombinase zinc beta ribbon domain